MLEWLDSFHRVMRYSHIAVGFAGLLLFWVPVFTTKGSRVHVMAGRVFLCCATYVGLTGLVASTWAVADPRSYGTSFLKDVSARAIPYVIESLRFFFSILGFLSLAVLAGVVFGLAAVRTRKDHTRLRHPAILGLQLALGLAAVALAAFGAWNLALGYSGKHLLPAIATNKYWVPVALGTLTAFGVWNDLKYILHPRPTPMAWWYKHMENMFGVGIGFHTAFLVFGASRYLSHYLQGPWQLLPWVLPAAIGLPVAAIWVRKYQRQFGELPVKTTTPETPLHHSDECFEMPAVSKTDQA